jgi:hypothetical protein
MKKILIILACFFFAAGTVIGYFRELKVSAHPSAHDMAVSLIAGGFIYLVVGAGLCLIFGLPLYMMWKQNKEKKNDGMQ